MRHFRDLTAVVLVLAIPGCGGPPPLDTTEAFSTADALYTAVTSRRAALVDDTETRLKKLHQEGKISPVALAALEEIIRQTRSGQWQDAAEELDGFIRYQPPRRHSH